MTLKELRKKKAMTLLELASLSGVSAISISRIEQGKHEARPSTRKKLAAALGVPVEQIDF
jgi:transcriptional regulator with XRE-family HTH domain